MTESAEPLLRAEGVGKSFFLRRPGLLGPRPRVQAVDSVDLDIERGESFGIVGESGSGKTTLARCLIRLLEADSGRVFFDGIDLYGISSAELRRQRRHFQMVFQDPYASLNPRLKVSSALAEPMRLHRLCQRREEKQEVARLLDRVGLSANVADRYPQEFSGGQRQRIGIARALACEPQLLVADEPVTALDVSVQAQIINLLADLQRDLGLTVLFIGHDLAVIEQLADRVAVMYLGRIVEQAPTRDLYARPQHPYTVGLLSAIPRVAPIGRRRLVAVGDPPSPTDPPPGCAFHPRCPLAEDRCREERPELVEISPGHRAACHFPGQLGSAGPTPENPPV